MKFSFYMVDAGYCDYLRKSDPCVPYTMKPYAPLMSEKTLLITGKQTNYIAITVKTAERKTLIK